VREVIGGESCNTEGSMFSINLGFGGVYIVWVIGYECTY